jgi:hypothetical protein
LHIYVPYLPVFCGKFFAPSFSQLEHLPRFIEISQFNKYEIANKFKLDISPHHHVIVTASFADMINIHHFQRETNTQNSVLKDILNITIGSIDSLQ